MHMHPGNGKSALLSMLSVGLYTATKLGAYAFMRVQRGNGKPTLNMLSVGLNSNKLARKYTFRQWKIFITINSFLCFHLVFLQQQSYALMHMHPGNRKSTLLSMLSITRKYASRKRKTRIYIPYF